MSTATSIDSVRDSIGDGPGVVLWFYREPVSGAGIVAANPFAEWAGGAPNVLYRRCFDVAKHCPGFRFPVQRFYRLLPEEKLRVVILHDPEIVQDLVTVLPDLAKACLGNGTRLVLVSENREFLDRCTKVLDPLSEALPVLRVGPDGNGRRISA